MIGWPITIWFRTEQEAADAAEAIGPFIAERFSNGAPFTTDEWDGAVGAVQRTFSTPSMALAVGHRFTKIPVKAGKSTR